MYQVHRRTGTAGPLTFLELVGKKEFVDKTVPEGVPCVEYTVRAIRSKKTGTAATYPVHFGVNAAAAILLQSVRTVA